MTVPMSPLDESFSDLVHVGTNGPTSLQKIWGISSTLSLSLFSLFSRLWNLLVGRRGFSYVSIPCSDAVGSMSWIRPRRLEEDGSSTNHGQSCCIFELAVGFILFFDSLSIEYRLLWSRKK